MKCRVLYFLFLTSILTSCLSDDLDNLGTKNWNPELTLPLVYADLRLSDVVTGDENELIIIDEQTGEIALFYSDTLVTADVNDLLALPEFDLNHSIHFTDTEIDQLIQNGSVTQTKNVSADISPHTDMEIAQMTLSNGNLDIRIRSDIEVSGDLEIRFPGFTKEGNPLVLEFPLDHTGSRVEVTESVDLSQYEVNLQHGGAEYNSFGIQYEFNADYIGQSVSVNDLLDIRLMFSRLEFLKLYGNIGKRNLLNTNGHIDLDVFNNSEGGFFALTDPSVSFKITNSFGLPIDIELLDFTSENTRNGQKVNILLDGFTNPFGIASPDNEVIGETAETEVSLNTDNSNIGRLIRPAPQRLSYRLRADANPGSQTSPPNLPNFITNQSEVQIETDIYLPLEGLAHSFVLADTLDFSLGEDLDPIDSLSFRLAVDNGFPLSAVVQMYFLNSRHQVMDSLFNQPTEIFAPAEVDDDGIVTHPAQRTTDIGYGPERAKAVKTAKYVVIKAQLKTTDAFEDEIVKVLNHYGIEIQLGMYVSGNVNL